MKILAWPFKLLVWIYMYGISPILPGTCRYRPTCSEYAITALNRFGPIKGSLLIFHRIFNCHPWGESGYDPVPERESVSCGCAKHKQ